LGGSASVAACSWSRIATEYASSPVAQPTDQALEDVGQHHPLQFGERLRIAEELGDRHQELVGEGLELHGVAAVQFEVVLESLEAVDLHAPLHPPQQGGAPIAGEVAPGPGADQGEELLQESLAMGGIRPTLTQHAGSRGGEVHDRRWDLVEAQHQVDHPRGDRRLGHAVVLGLERVLRDREAAALLDAAQPEGPIAAGAGEDHTDRVAVVGLGEGTEEVIDGRALAAIALERREAQRGVDARDVRVRRDHVDVVRPERGLARDLHHRHPGRDLE
jgi:hypothetical protein